MKTLEDSGRRILRHGLAMVLVGLVWGTAVAHLPFPRLALVAHVQLTGNGVMFTVMALLLLVLNHRVTSGQARVMLGAVWLNWPMFLAQIANAWWGTRGILPIAAAEAGAPGAAPWQEAVLTGTHVVGGVAVLVAWVLLVRGFAGLGQATRQA